MFYHTLIFTDTFQSHILVQHLNDGRKSDQNVGEYWCMIQHILSLHLLVYYVSVNIPW